MTHENNLSEQVKPDWRGYLYDHFLEPVIRFFRPVHPSEHTGMGAIPHDRGTTFRVWAPHAEKVYVAGSFNKWSPRKTPLAHEENGYWSADVADAGPGDEYKFVIRNGNGALLKADPYALDVTPELNNSVVSNGRFEWETDEDEEPFVSPGWHELVIYELHVGTFNKTSEEEVVGTFEGVVEKLPYLKELGINAIELMPVMEFSGAYSWGYNPAHPFAITRTYGGRNAFNRLIKAAHAHGIAVIVDVVYNHFGPQNLDLWQFDGWQQDGKGGIYFYNDWRSQTPWADTRPDYGRPEVRQYIRDNALLWLEKYHVDGLRWDATGYIRNAHGHDGDPGADIAEGWELMRWVNDEINARQPWKINIAEDLQGNAWITKDTGDGGAGFDAQWDAQFVHPLRHAVITPHDEARDMPAVAAAISARYNDDAFERVIYTESHDEVANGKARVPEEIAPGEADNYFAQKRSLLGAAIVFTSPGIPMLFQGQEFLEDGWFDDHVPLDWSKAEKNAGILELYRELIRLRRNWYATTRGLTGQHVNVYHVNDDDKIIAFHRWYEGGPGDDVVVVANFTNQSREAYTVGFPQSGLWQVRLNSDLKRYAADFSDHHCPDVIAASDLSGASGLPYFGNVTLGPYAVLIFSQ